jgi:phosphatidylethanolamine/phosphatidyl-N-methylethanolamine N-methyltransferase
MPEDEQQTKAQRNKFRALSNPYHASRRGTIVESDVISAYRRWAPVSDHTFGLVATEGRKHSVEIINRGSGRVLEVGVGTGLSLPLYKHDLEIVGVDLSPEMLDKARERADEARLTNVTGLHVMDAS